MPSVLKLLSTRIKLSPETRKNFTWQNMKGPVSVTFAAFVGIVLTQVLLYYRLPENMPLETADLVSTTVLVMEMGTSEKLYVKSAFRVIGVLVGISIGILLAFGEAGIIKLFQDQFEENPWTVMVLRICVLSPMIFASCLLMKKYSKYSSSFSVMAVHISIAMMAKTLYKSAAITITVLMAVFISSMALVMFEKFTSESLLIDTNRKCIYSVLSVVQLSAIGDKKNSGDFKKHSDEVHKSISSAESALETYFKWRQMTCRKPIHDFKALLKPVRPLFYQAYSLYWGNVSSVHAEKYNAEILFCNDEKLFEQIFRKDVEELVKVIENIKESLTKVLVYDANLTSSEIADIIDDIIMKGLYNGICRIQESLKKSYFKNRNLCFISSKQKWHFLDYLKQLAMITLAFLEFMKALVDVFESDLDKRTRLLNLLEELTEGMDLLRKDDGSANDTMRFGENSTIKPSVAGSSVVSLGVTSPRATDGGSVTTIPEDHEPNDHTDETRRLLFRASTMGGL